eukprot:1145631-Pelagomonas_calceolata.AAC.9
MPIRRRNINTDHALAMGAEARRFVLSGVPFLIDPEGHAGSVSRPAEAVGPPSACLYLYTHIKQH